MHWGQGWKEAWGYMSGSPEFQFRLPISHLGTLGLSLPLAASTNVSIHLHLTLTSVMPHMVIKQLPGGLRGVVKTSPSSTGSVGLIPGWGTKIPHAS